MFPTIPDKFHKVIITFGAIVSVYFYLELNKIDNEIQNLENKIFELDNINDDMVDKTAEFEIFILAKSKDMSKYYGIENPILKENDTSISFSKYIYVNNKVKQKYNDSLIKLWDIYKEKSKLLESKLKLNIKKIDKFRQEITNKNDKKNSFGYYAIFSGFITILGLVMWFLDEIYEENKKSVVKVEDKIYRYCQSCGLQFSSVRKYGTNSDESNSNAFCEDCFKNGQFIENELTIDGLIERVMANLNGRNYFKRKLIIERLRNLERWNRDKYKF